VRTSERKIACVAQPFTYTLASMQCLTVFAHLLCWTLVLSFTCFYVYREKANDVVSVIEEARNTLIIGLKCYFFQIYSTHKLLKFINSDEWKISFRVYSHWL